MSVPISAPDCFLFDIGNVLVTFDFEPALAAARRRSRRGTLEAFQQVYALKDRLESGRLSDQDFIDGAIDALGYEGSEEEFRDLWNDIFSPNPPMWEVAGQLAERFPLYLLSNTSGLHMDHLMAKFDVFRHFKDGIYSHSAGCMKPGEGMFRQAIERFGLEPERTIYIDDLPANAATGRRLGFDTIEYQPEQHGVFLRELKKRGLEVKSGAVARRP